MSKGDETRERIIQRAAAKFNQTGYAATSMSDIMRETGLEKGGIYNHFSSKEELMYAAFEYATSLATERFREIFATTKHSLDRVIAIAEYYYEAARDILLPGGCPVLNAAIEADDTHPVLKAKAKAAMMQLVDTITRTLEKGKTRAEIRPEADSHRAAIYLICTMEGAVMMSRLYGNEHPLDIATDQVRHYCETVLRMPASGA